MDKETLSNYGWIVILVLILAVLLALATPFGNFIAGAFKATYVGFGMVGDNALGIVIPGSDNKNNEEMNPSGYRFMNHIDQGDYRYFYYGCNNEEEFGFGYLKLALYEEGVVCATDEEILENVAQLMFECSWADLQAQGYTPTKLFNEMGITDEYNRVKTEVFLHNGWWVQTIDKTKTEYEPIPEQVDGIPVTVMQQTFYRCAQLKIAPIIPSGITNMCETFSGCTSLKTYEGSTDPDGDFSEYIIPSSVTDMESTFYECTQLEIAPAIPNGVVNMFQTFLGCTSLTGTVEINANPTSYSSCFVGVDFESQNITLVGDSTKLDSLGTTGKNYCATCNGKCNGGH